MKKLFLFVLALNGIVAQAQFTIPDVPSFQTSVYDYADVLNPTEEKELENKLVRYSDSTTTQIVVITVEDLKGEDIGILTPKWAHQWGIGQEKEDNGILILLSKNDRKIHISPGYGVEDRLTAGINGELIRNVIIPEFKAGSYYTGLDKGADAIFQVLKGKYKGRETIHTPAGDFDCIKIYTEQKGKVMFISETEYSIDWYAKNIGLVKSETITKKGKVISTTLLYAIKE